MGLGRVELVWEWRGQSCWWLWRRTPLTRHAALPLVCIEKHLKITSWLQDSNAVKLKLLAVRNQLGIPLLYSRSMAAEFTNCRVGNKKLTCHSTRRNGKASTRSTDERTKYKRDDGSCRTDDEAEIENCQTIENSEFSDFR
jgi:hypothetical protein